jgi:hypothetical protein
MQSNSQIHVTDDLLTYEEMRALVKCFFIEMVNDLERLFTTDDMVSTLVNLKYRLNAAYFLNSAVDLLGKKEIVPSIPLSTFVLEDLKLLITYYKEKDRTLPPIDDKLFEDKYNEFTWILNRFNFIKELYKKKERELAEGFAL